MSLDTQHTLLGRDGMRDPELWVDDQDSGIQFSVLPLGEEGEIMSNAGGEAAIC
jgi:hypothetical protein